MDKRSAFAAAAAAAKCVKAARRQRGVTSIEYALLGALIAVAIVGVVTTLGLTLNDFYTLVSDEVANAAPSSGN